MPPDLPSTALARHRLRVPRIHAAVVMRPRLEELFAWALTHQVTLVEAEAGYGKTTLAQSASADLPRVWYSLSSDDRDPMVFLTHLAATLEPHCPGLLHRLTRRLPGPDRAESSWSELVELVVVELDGIAGTELLVVLDDYHQVDTASVNLIVERLVDGLPPGIRLLITTRSNPALPCLARWRATGVLCAITRTDLAFTADEVAGYWRGRFGLDVSSEQSALLVRETEGWPIALGLIGAHLRHVGGDTDALVEQLPEGREELFAYLGDQVLARLSPHLHAFLLATAAPRSFDAGLAALLSGRADAALLLERVLAAGLFCTTDGRGNYRYHHLFRDFLLAQCDGHQLRDGHLRTADYLERAGALEEGLFHAFEAGDHSRAARLLERLGDSWIRAGRSDAFLQASGRLPVAVRADSPRLLIHRSHAFRLACDYPEAVAEARAAASDRDARSDALAAEIEVYLDSVQPRRAVPLLAALCRTAHTPAERVRRLAMLAEHRVNAGEPDRARQAQRRWAAAKGGVAARDARLEVRRGDLHQARRLLETAAEDDLLVHRSHREREPLLAWTYGLLGNGGEAAAYARRGIARGQERGSRSVLFVSTSRLAHALQCGDTPETEAAVQHYQTALAVVAQTGVPRLRAESLIGLTIASGRLGEVDGIRGYGLEAVDLLTEAGDAYMAAMARLAMGAAAATAGHPDARRWLAEAQARGRRSGDVYIPTLAAIWLAHMALEHGDASEFEEHAGSALAAMREYGLDALLLHAPWLGVHGAERRRALLQRARRLPALAEYAGYLLGRIPVGSGATSASAKEAASDAGLRLFTLGRFAAVKDGMPIAARWERRKAKELLWLLCGREQRSVPREEAMELLWPDADPDTASPRLRVALHSLRVALEPGRPSRGPARFVHTEGDRITLDPAVRLDWTEFRRLARLALDCSTAAQLIGPGRQAIALYQGSYLEDAADLPWVEELRESLRVTFIELALRAAEAELAGGALSATAELAHRVLREDPYREGAYRTLARLHLSSGDTAAALRVFHTCSARLAADLGIGPSWRLSDL
jgi:LuxR family transcriptional regulator, maltose regulon positive regulatory protein